jgi:hypothetical protein
LRAAAGNLRAAARNLRAADRTCTGQRIPIW